MDTGEASRTCIVSRASLPEAQLIRFVAGPDGTVVPDLKRRLPGRGAWVEATAVAVATAAKKKLFARALKVPVQTDAELAGRVQALLLARALGQFGMAYGQGSVVVGATKVDNAIGSGKLALVLFAGDAATDSRRKLANRLASSDDAPPWLFEGFTVEQMSLAIGRANVVHAGVAPGRAAAAVQCAVRRLDGYLSARSSLTAVKSLTGVIRAPGVGVERET
ncbi:MAG: RNA-binding protein [Hyphomicrobiales bacterium]